MVGLKLKNICNFIDNSKLKKIVIKRTWIKCEGKINYKGWSEFLKRLAQNSMWRDEKKKKQSLASNSRSVWGTCYPITSRAPRPLRC